MARRPASSSAASAADASARTAPPSTRRRWTKRLLALAFGLAVFPGLPELIVRWADPPLDGFQAVEFGGDKATPRLFVNDWDLSWKLRPDARVRFQGVAITVDRHGFRALPDVAARRTLLCLGDSTTFGWKMEDGRAYPDLLHAALAERSDGPWRTLNAGVPGYSSEQTRRLAERLIPQWNPDVVVVCIGNNDGWPVERGDRRSFDERSAWHGRLVAGLRHFHFAQWIKDRAAERSPRDLVLADLEHAVPRTSRDEYRENLAAIADLATARGARVVFVAPPVNVQHQPMRVDAAPGFAAYQDDARRVATALGAGRRDEARALLARYRERHPDDYRYVWLEGAAACQTGDVPRGLDLLEEALELDPFPEGCKPSYRRAVEEVATERRALFVDANRVFREHARPGAPARLYLDWCHPTAEGHRLLAAEILRALDGKFDGKVDGRTDADESAAPQ